MRTAQRSTGLRVKIPHRQWYEACGSLRGIELTFRDPAYTCASGWTGTPNHTCSINSNSVDNSCYKVSRTASRSCMEETLAVIVDIMLSRYYLCCSSVGAPATTCHRWAQLRHENRPEEPTRVLPDAAVQAYRPSLLRRVHFQHHRLCGEKPGQQAEGC